MAYSKITITFDGVPGINDRLLIREESTGISLLEVFKEERLGSGQIAIPPFEEDDGIRPDRYIGFISTNYKRGFDLDYNATKRFTVTNTNGQTNTGIGVVEITANYENAEFTVLENTGPITTQTENQAVVPDFSIDSFGFSTQAGEEASKCSVSVTTNNLAAKVISPIVRNSNTENPIIFPWFRGKTFAFEVEDENGTRASKTITTPDYLNIENFTIEVSNSPNGATVSASYVDSKGLIIEYSLNGTDWQSENYFSGLEVGSYTLWVRDQLGDSKTKSFEVSEFGIYSPYFYISKSNSIRFARRIEWGSSSNYKSEENTLSNESDSNVKYTEIQQFQSEDIIRTQFKSNYSLNNAKVVKTDLSEIEIPVVKMSANIGRKDKRDAIKYDIGEEKTGVYFVSGNTYDYDTGEVSGSYLLNGLLPEWAEIGGYIQIGNAWFLISETAYDEEKNAEIIIIESSYAGDEVGEVVGSIFNRFDYEIYEFEIDMSGYVDEYFNVLIINTDDNFETITHQSEVSLCKVKHEKVLEIKYSNSKNTDMFYGTGIKNLIRIPYTIIKGRIDEENETHKTDTTALLLSSEMYEVEDFVFEPVTKGLWRKLAQALSHELVTINGIGYVKSGDFNTDGPLEESNLYVLTAAMIKTGEVYNSNASGSIEEFFDEVPGLMQSENGYVSH
jgi:hypothetical protein